MTGNFDVVIIGAGSVGVPAAMELAQNKLKVLVIDKYPSVGQGQNKSAIGGIRATHSDKAKIKTAIKSIEIFSAWQDKHGDDINWYKGGYLYPVYNENDRETLTELLQTQKNFGLNIGWIDNGEVSHLVKGIKDKNLLGAVYSPDDGSASPLLAINAFYRRAKEMGVQFNFNETVTRIKISNAKISGVKTNKGNYNSKIVINAAGGYAREIAKLARIDIAVTPDMHQAGITEPVKRMLEPMVVDVSIGKNSKNYYFYQTPEGQIVFCMTPFPALIGTDRNSTSTFLPSISQRMIDLIPKLSGIKVRRVWRGLYPMTPDGNPIVDTFKQLQGFICAAGMCGQGFMLCPGIAKLLSAMVTEKLTKEDNEILNGFSAVRNFSGMEVYK